MSGVFWVVTVAMTVLAIAFLAMPLLGSDRRKTAIALAISLPVFAIGLYMVFGSPQLESGRSASLTTTAGPAEKSPASNREKVGSVSSMVDGLAARLEENPNDGKGWLLLARSYKHIDRIDDAVIAYAKAEALGESDPELATLSSDQASSDISSAQVLGNLSLSDRARDIVQPTDTVFVFARAAGGSGVPAAVLQRRASELPIDFSLNDSQSMVQGIKLSDFDEVVVTARISRSGDATEALQNLEAKSSPVLVAGNQRITLIIE
jgi:hypothetical protein